MASPQCEQGFTRLSNEYFDALLLVSNRLTKRELAVVLAVVRYTWGFNRKASSISVRQLEKITSIKFTKCHEVLKALVLKGLISVELLNKRNVCSPVKDYESWAIWDVDLSEVLSSRYGEQERSPNWEQGSSQNGVQAVPETGNATVHQTGNNKKQKDSIERQTTSVEDEWLTVFPGCSLPDTLALKAANMLMEISGGLLDPSIIKFPIPFLKKWKPVNGSARLPAAVAEIKLVKGMVVIWEGTEHVLQEGGWLRTDAGCVPHNALLQGIADNIIQIKEG